MSRPCKACGVELSRMATCCPACAELVPCALRIVGPSGSITMRVDTIVGRALLERVGGKAAAHASWRQFRVWRDLHGQWLICALPEAVRPTIVNRRPLGLEGQQLSPGDLLRVGDATLEARVEIDAGDHA
jgi:hypothetical protein